MRPRPGDERAQAATSRLSEVPQYREEWEELLQVLKLADSPVGEAIHLCESRGYGARFGAHREDDMERKRRKVCELWRFVPDLLALEVAYIEEEEETERTGTVGRHQPLTQAGIKSLSSMNKCASGLAEVLAQIRLLDLYIIITRTCDTLRYLTYFPGFLLGDSCIWMQTLPNVVQINVLTFLNLEHNHFRSKDLEALALRMLQCPLEADFWVFQAAKALLYTSSLSAERKLSRPLEEEQFLGVVQDAEMADYNKLPEWLDTSTEDSSSMFSWLPLQQTDDFKEEKQDHDKNHRLRTSEPSQTDLGVPAMEVQSVQEPMPERENRAFRAPGRHTQDPTTGENYTLDEEILDTSENGVQLNQDDDVVNREDENNAKAALGEDLYLQALTLGRALRSSPEPGLAEEIKLVRTSPKFSSLLFVARAWEVEDEVTLLLVGSLLVEQDGYAWSTQVLQTIMLPKLFVLDKPASRILTTAVTQAGKIHPRAIMDSVVFPLICSKDGATSIQCELLNRIVKDCLPEDLILSLLQKMFLSCADRNHCSGLSWKWTEGMVGVVQNLLNYKVNLDQQSIICLLKALDVAVAEFSKSLKFGNLLLNLVTKHGSRLKLHKELLQQVVDKSGTFLTKSVQTKLASF